MCSGLLVNPRVPSLVLDAQVGIKPPIPLARRYISPVAERDLQPPAQVSQPAAQRRRTGTALSNGIAALYPQPVAGSGEAQFQRMASIRNAPVFPSVFQQRNAGKWQYRLAAYP